MPFVTLGISNHDNLQGVSAADHHPQTNSGDIELGSMSERNHGSLLNVTAVDHAPGASQVNMEGEATSNFMLRPDRIRFSPGVAKVLAHMTLAGALSSPSYNVASVTDVGTGDRTVVFDDDFSTAIFQITYALLEENISGGQSQIYHSSLAVGSVKHRIWDEGVNLQDQVSSITIHGDQ